MDGNACLSDCLPLCCPTPHSVSLDSVLGDVRSLQRGLELTQREFVRQDDCLVLKEFLRANSPTMDKLLADSKTAQVGRGWPSPGGGEAWGAVKVWRVRDAVGEGAGGPPARRCRDEVAGVSKHTELLGVGAGGADRLCPQEAYESVVEYFGENPKTTSPSMFFSLFSRFIKAYKVCVSGGRPGPCGAFQPLHLGSVKGRGRSVWGRARLPSRRPTLARQKAEQEVEQWRKEAVAQEAGTDAPGKEEAPAPKVGSCA